MKNSLKKYEIHQKLGSGSYGVIYKAVNKTDRSVCVLKQINLSRMGERAKKNAINEATIMGKLKHPFIVCYYESFIEERTLNILMEYCDGGDLSIYLKQQNKKFLKEEKIWRFFIEICLGLEHIHKNKILHRDIKSLNIFLNKNGTVKIGDLGVAKMLMQNDFAQTMVGTPYYLSPELCEEKPYNQKSDIWALGCLLYELCTFKHPFEAANQASLILKIIRGKFSPIPDFYSKDLKDMIDWCLQRDYKRRPTAALILSKPIVKKYLEQFKIEKVISDFNTQLAQKKAQKNANSTPNTVKPEIQKKTSENKIQPMSSKQIEKPKPAKVLDDVAIKKNEPIKEKEVLLPKKNQIPQPQPPLPSKALPRRVSERRIVNDEDRPKVLFGNVMPESKEQFISNLEAKIDKSKPVPLPKQQRKDPVYFEIPARDTPTNRLKMPINEPSPKDKITIHNKILLEEQGNQKHKDSYSQIQRVRMQKKISPKVYEQVDKPRGIIKSSGFGKVQDNRASQKKIDMNREKKNENGLKKVVEKKESSQRVIEKSKDGGNTRLKDQRQVSYSMRNVRKQPEDRPNYLNVRRDSNGNVPVHYPPRVKKPPSAISNQKIKPVVHNQQQQRKSTSTSRYHQLTKQQEQMVANLPDIIRKRESSSDEEYSSTPKLNKGFKLNEIDDEMIAKKYEEIIDTQPSVLESDRNEIRRSEEEDEDNLEQASTKKVISSSEGSVENEEDEDKIEQILEKDRNSQESRNSGEVQEDLNGSDQVDEDSLEEQNIFEVNKFEMENPDDQWSFDAQPELPMLEQTQTPYFQEANLYLVQQKEKTEEQALEDKKKYLQEKLKQNMKREDQINQLMQLKIQECRSVVPKGFEEILQFFRSKINMDREYTDEDEREVQAFLSSRNLTNQRKFQNIYKIMHFEMELENTRRIIQTICKKLNQLEVS